MLPLSWACRLPCRSLKTSAAPLLLGRNLHPSFRIDARPGRPSGLPAVALPCSRPLAFTSTFAAPPDHTPSTASQEQPSQPPSTSDPAPTPTIVGYKGSTAAVRTYKPRTPGLRHLRRPVNDHLWRGRPFLALTIPKKGHSLGGRNSTGKITVRHRGGGAKRRLRTVDFFRWAPGPHLVLRIEHDPGRSAHIALVVERATGMRSYILAAEGMRAGDVVYSFRSGVPARLVEEMGGQIDPGVMAARTTARGNCLPIHMVPVGTQVYNVGNYAGGAGVFCRSAGTYAVVVAKDEESPEEMAAAVAEADAEMKADEADTDTTGIPPSRPKVKTSYVTVRLQSGEVRRVSRHACCTIGVASNPNHQFRQLGKAGRARWLGIRPTVRGVAMNKVDHPHGGGRGKSKGNRIPVSPWGKPAKGGYKTRRKRNVNKYVVTPRPRNMGKRRTKAK